MSLYDDMERCSGCMARLRPGGCTRWGWEEPPCERDYGYSYSEEPEEDDADEDDAGD